MDNKIKAPTGFRLVNWTGSHRQFFGKFGIIDLSKLTVQKAENLVKKGFSKLEKVTTNNTEGKSQSSKGK